MTLSTIICVMYGLFMFNFRSADEMNKSSVKKTNKGLKLKKPKKRK